MRRVNVVAHGLVQGVFFRASTRDEARRHGVTGWVRNRGDGAVEAEFEGSDDALDAMVAFCRRGPGSAVIEHLQVRDVPAAGDNRFVVE
jgi:acylphosphatase